MLPRRWVVERTIACSSTAAEELVKDWENPQPHGAAFLRLASIRLMLRKLL